MTDLEFVRSCRDMQSLALRWRRMGRRVGLVPTMGALHAGHLSLVEQARRECDVVVTSIFVNPTQFGPREDFSKYPRTLEQDIELLRGVGCDVVFSPEASDVYPPGCTTAIEPPHVAQRWEGAFRPGHFRGVCTVVLKLFELVPNDASYFGRKDYQQSLVIRHMVRDLNLPVGITVCPIVREPDGLAMSSRNRYLSPPEREQALGLYRALRAAEQWREEGETAGEKIERAMTDTLRSHGIERIDYVACVDPETLEPQADIARATVALIACYVGQTRLIDNFAWTDRP